MQIENIKQLMDGLDIAAMLPSVDSLVELTVRLSRLGVMLPALLLLGIGLYLFLLPPKSRENPLAYRFRWAMGSREAWEFTQRLVSYIWSGTGLIMCLVLSFVTARYPQMEPMDMLLNALWVLAAETLVILVCRQVVNIWVFSRFDRKGNRRLTWRELFQA